MDDPAWSFLERGAFYAKRRLIVKANPVLAADGIRFTSNAYAVPICAPAVVSVTSPAAGPDD
jgi:hypothetical protein